MQQEWALRRKRTRRLLWLLNDPQGWARRFGLPETQVKQISDGYRDWIRTLRQVWKMGRGRIRRQAALHALLKAGRPGGAIMLAGGDRKRLSDEEAAITRQAVLAVRRKRRGPAFAAAMRLARSLGLQHRLLQADDILDARVLICRLCGRVFVRPWNATAQRYCPACKQRRSSGWFRAKSKPSDSLRPSRRLRPVT